MSQRGSGPMKLISCLWKCWKMGSDIYHSAHLLLKKFPASVFLSRDRKPCFSFPNTVICSFIVFLHAYFPDWRRTQDDYLSIVSNDKPTLIHVCHVEGILNSNCLSLGDVINHFSCHQYQTRSNLWQEDFISVLSLRDTVLRVGVQSSVLLWQGSTQRLLVPWYPWGSRWNQTGLQLSKFTPWRLQLGPAANSSTQSQSSVTNCYQWCTGF